jgi:hypothetical protein
MAEEKKKRFFYTTPVGTLRYPNLDKARQFINKKGKPEGKPKLDCGWIAPDAATQKKVEKDLEAGMKGLGWSKGEGTPWKTDKKDGTVYLKAQTGEDFRPIVQDAKCNDIPLGVKIGGGSKGRLMITLDYYDGFGGGCTAYLNGVQIAKLVEYKAGGQFDAIDGYEYEGEDDGEGGDGQSFGELPDAEGMHEF